MTITRKTAYIRIFITIALTSVAGVCAGAAIPSAAHAATAGARGPRSTIPVVHALRLRQPGHAPLAHHRHRDFPWG
ncbi:hypothetical protein ACQP2K_36440 [Microbispora siamensis]